MTFAVFQQQLERVSGLDFRPRSLQTHWEALQDMDEADLTRAITWGQRRWERFPSPTQVREAAALSLPRDTTAEDYRGEWRCAVCRDTGWAEIPGDEHRRHTRCDCWNTNPVLLRRRERLSQQAAQRAQVVKS